MSVGNHQQLYALNHCSKMCSKYSLLYLLKDIRRMANLYRTFLGGNVIKNEFAHKES